jgi:hypothetical protein
MACFRQFVGSIGLCLVVFSTAAGCPAAPVDLADDAICLARQYLSKTQYAETPMKYRAVDLKEYWLVYYDPLDKAAREGWGQLRVYKAKGEIAVVGLHPFATPNTSLERTRAR